LPVVLLDHCCKSCLGSLTSISTGSFLCLPMRYLLKFSSLVPLAAQHTHTHTHTCSLYQANCSRCYPM
jgi:hypothetical protein